ncbi:MAG: RNA polymerase sigma factor RpoD/SigA [Spirochaetes bacterium]|jgi:RNA polymerase primary sigma factor|nr:RNA polymerase sigma factor RpoD/SigA [Spirochaetota bacterium]
MSAIVAVNRGAVQHNQLNVSGGSVPDDFAVAYKGLVSSIAKNYASYQCPFEDLVQEGFIGLIRAFEKFDPSLGCKYTTYATYWIKHYITRYIAKHGRVVRLPIKKSELYRKISKVRDYLSHEMGETPTLEQIAAYAEVQIDDVKRILDIFQPELSFETPFRDSTSDRYEIVEDEVNDGPEHSYFNEELKRELKHALDQLMDKERQIISMRFGLETGTAVTLKDVADKYEISSETVRQIEKRALIKIRTRFAYLKDYLYA